MSEDQKYGKSGTKIDEPKGMKQQENFKAAFWKYIDNGEDIDPEVKLAFQRAPNVDNIPRKEKQFKVGSWQFFIFYH